MVAGAVVGQPILAAAGFSAGDGAEDSRTASRSRLEGGCGQDCPPHLWAEKRSAPYSSLKLTPASSIPAAGSSAASPVSGSAAGWKLNQRARASSLTRRRLMMILLRRKAPRKPLATCQKAASDRGSARRQPPTTRR